MHQSDRISQKGPPHRWGEYQYNPKCKCDWCSNGGEPSERWKKSSTPGIDTHNTHFPASRYRV